MNSLSLVNHPSNIFELSSWKNAKKEGRFLKIDDDGRIRLVYLSCIQQLLRKILGFYSSTHLRNVVQALSMNQTQISRELGSRISESWTRAYPSERMPELIFAQEPMVNREIPIPVVDQPQNNEIQRVVDQPIPAPREVVLQDPVQRAEAPVAVDAPRRAELSPKQLAKKIEWNELAKKVFLVKDQPIIYGRPINEIPHPFHLNNSENLVRFLLQCFPAIQFFNISDVKQEAHEWIVPWMDCPIRDDDGALALVEGICIQFKFQHEFYKVHLRAADEVPSGLWRREKEDKNWELFALNVAIPPEFVT